LDCLKIMSIPFFQGIIDTRFKASCYYYLLFPVGDGFDPSRISSGASQIVKAAIAQAKGLAQTSVEGLAVDLKNHLIINLESSQNVPLRNFHRRGCHYLFNLGFLTSDDPPLGQMGLCATQKKVVWCGTRSSHDIHACAFLANIRVQSFSPNFLWTVFTHLTATIDTDTDSIWHDVADANFITPSGACFEHSPAMDEVASQSKRWANSPRFLNTAIQELSSSQQVQPPVDSNPFTMAQMLLSQRKISQVPWVFNTLLNEIEYRLGVVQPQSFPPEIHFSTTGFCNIACRFCSYTPSVGRFEFTTAKQIAKLDFLKYVQTLRLHSGLGEPTTNKHLPDIIRYVAQHYPHIGINFFTNGLNLNRPGMLNAIVGNVRWINVSLNAATRESWKQQCKIDQFDHVCDNLQVLLNSKKAKQALWPLVFGSMVLNKSNVTDLPLMPALCRRLGIDRFTAFPFFALGYGGIDKYGAEMTLSRCRSDYDELYWQTIEEAKIHRVSIEIPKPSEYKKTAFGLEIRSLNDFAHIESNEWPLGRFLTQLAFSEQLGSYCHFLWRQVGIGNTNNCGHSETETHYLYPCIGPLSGVDLSRQTSFRFPNAENFLALWNNPVFSHLRAAQSQSGICEVCDLCRQKDTRDPKEFAQLEQAVDEFTIQFV
jgi:molybdenum cofactor biosynthesis enzyme MoaA